MAGAQKRETWRGQIRMPAPIAEWLQQKAQANFRSVNAEIVEVIRRAKEVEQLPSQPQGAQA